MSEDNKLNIFIFDFDEEIYIPQSFYLVAQPSKYLNEHVITDSKNITYRVPHIVECKSKLL